MKNYVIECQINAADDRRFVPVQADSYQQAASKANEVVRDQVGKDPAVKGCIVVGAEAKTL